jgi:Thioredoxin like C-terminal domain
VRVLVDGRPVSSANAGRDVHGGSVQVRGQRLYWLVALPGAQQHEVTVQIPPGVSAYDFTFG